VGLAAKGGPRRDSQTPYLEKYGQIARVLFRGMEGEGGGEDFLVMGSFLSWENNLNEENHGYFLGNSYFLVWEINDF
jgi:hypothetical protein